MLTGPRFINNEWHTGVEGKSFEVVSLIFNWFCSCVKADNTHRSTQRKLRCSKIQLFLVGC